MLCHFFPPFLFLTDRHILTPPADLLQRCTEQVTSKPTHLISFGGNGSSAMPSPKDNGWSGWKDPVGKTGTCNAIRSAPRSTCAARSQHLKKKKKKVFTGPVQCSSDPLFSSWKEISDSSNLLFHKHLVYLTKPPPKKMADGDWQTAPVSERTSCVRWQHLFQSKTTRNLQDRLPPNIYSCICGNSPASVHGILNS